LFISESSLFIIEKIWGFILLYSNSALSSADKK
jgi:hypothetical protein